MLMLGANRREQEDERRPRGDRQLCEQRRGADGAGRVHEERQREQRSKEQLRSRAAQRAVDPQRHVGAEP